jgi:hypothetical protein
MTDAQALSPGEVVVLLDLNAARAREALKVTVLSLLVKGVFRIQEKLQTGLLKRVKRSTVLALSPSAPTALPGPEGAVFQALAPVGPDGEAMPAAVALLQKQFGKDLSRFVSDHVRPALIARGLLEAYRDKFLWIFPVTRYRPTPTGEVEQRRLQGLMQQAREIPSYLDRDPAQAVAIMAALGSSVLLVEELRPHLSQLGTLMSAPLDAPLFGTDDASWSDISDNLSAVDFSDLDFSSFDALDQALADFDASFDTGSDSSDSSSDSGGSGGD